MKNYHAPGDWNVITDCCGMKRKFSQCVKQWDGLIVCPEHCDPRHPLDFIKSTHDDQRVPIARPQSPYLYRDDLDGTVGTTNAISDSAFADIGYWKFQTGWSIAGGTGICDGSQTTETMMFQDGALGPPGLVYDVTFTLAGYTAGEMWVKCGGTNMGTIRSANGSYAERITVGGNPFSRFAFVGDVDFQGVITAITAYLVTY